MEDCKATPLRVNTPEGVKHHCYLIEEKEGGKKYIYRQVKESDRLRIFDAWSLNPNVYDKLKKEIAGIRWEDELCYYDIGIEKANKVLIDKTYSGGRTYYFPIKELTITDKNNKQLKI